MGCGHAHRRQRRRRRTRDHLLLERDRRPASDAPAPAGARAHRGGPPPGCSRRPGPVPRRRVGTVGRGAPTTSWTGPRRCRTRSRPVRDGTASSSTSSSPRVPGWPDASVRRRAPPRRARGPGRRGRCVSSVASRRDRAPQHLPAVPDPPQPPRPDDPLDPRVAPRLGPTRRHPRRPRADGPRSRGG